MPSASEISTTIINGGAFLRNNEVLLKQEFSYNYPLNYSSSHKISPTERTNMWKTNSHLRFGIVSVLLFYELRFMADNLGSKWIRTVLKLPQSRHNGPEGFDWGDNVDH